MARDIYEVKYQCEDGCNYGSCSKTNAFVFIHYRGSDRFSLFQKSHIEDEKSRLEWILGGSAFDELDALRKILHFEGEYISDELYKDIKKQNI